MSNLKILKALARTVLEKNAADFTVERRKLDEAERMHKIVEQHMSANANRRASGAMAAGASGLGTMLLSEGRIKSMPARFGLVAAATTLGGLAGRNLEDRWINRRLKKLENPDAKHWIVKRGFLEPTFVCSNCGAINNSFNNPLLMSFQRPLDLGAPPTGPDPTDGMVMRLDLDDAKSPGRGEGPQGGHRLGGGRGHGGGGGRGGGGRGGHSKGAEEIEKDANFD